MIGFDGQCEAGVRFSIFVGAIEQCFLRQRFDLRQGRPHLFSRPFEETPAPERENCIANERRGLFCEVVDDMTGRMAGCVKNVSLGVADRDCVAFADGPVDAWNFFRFVPWANDFAVPVFFQREIAARVVKMVVGVQNKIEPPAFGVEAGVDLVRLRRVDCRDDAGLFIPYEITVIVAEAGKLFDGEGHHKARFIG